MIIQHIPEYPFNNTSDGIVNAQEDKSTPKLEALVRESLQNSLDASNGSNELTVEFGYEPYDVCAVSGVFPDIAPILESQHNYCLYVKDWGTVGLTGDISDKKANYCGLVKKIGQTGKDAGTLGGSWGKGKSVFYRQGIGFVIFYSRIKSENGLFESRMNAVFANWKNLDYNPIPDWAGISIWGGEKYRENDVTPIYDEQTIESMLNGFGIAPYSGDETGTVIIMPAVSEKDLLADVEEGTEHDYEKTWLVSVEGCLDFYIQKWFSPRLNNTIEGKPTLRCMVNHVPVKLKHNLFLTLQSLYNDTFDLSKKNVDYLRLRNQNNSYGNIAWKICNEKELQNIVAHNPYKLCDIHSISEKGNSPIVAYVRSPGMFLTFEDPVFENLPGTDSESYLIAVFRLNPDENTRVKLKNGQDVSLEGYVRSTEKSNHSGWKDISSSSDKFVSNIMGQIKNKLSNQLKSGENTKVSGRRSTDGRFVAERLFPESSYIHSMRDKKCIKNTTRTRTGKRKEPDIYSTELSEKQSTEGVVKTISIQFVDKQIALIRLGAIYSESLIFYRENWESDLGSPFPTSFLSFSITSYTDDHNSIVECDIKSTPNTPKVKGDRFTVQWLDHSDIKIVSGRPNAIMTVELLIRRPDDTMILPVLNIASRGEKDE